jgi:hypothetical protein
MKKKSKIVDIKNKWDQINDWNNLVKNKLMSNNERMNLKIEKSGAKCQDSWQFEILAWIVWKKVLKAS